MTIPLDSRYVPYVRAFLVQSSDNTELITHDNAQVIYTIIHYRVHAGQTFRAWYLVPDDTQLADNGSIDIVFTAGALIPNITYAVGAGGNSEVIAYRSPNFNGDGTPLTAHNLDDNSTTTATANVVLNPTINSVGTEIDAEFIAGGSGGLASGGAIRTDTEDLWKPNTSYLIRLTNRSGQARQFSIELQWYEEAEE